MNNNIRLPAVAGTFYPDNPVELRKLIDNYLNQTIKTKVILPGKLKALIVPHAGYPYSGPVAGNGYYHLLQDNKRKIKRVWLIGPSHQRYLQEAAVSTADYWQTSLGEVSIDKSVRILVEKYPSLFKVNNSAHQDEHSLEVQLPFLQRTLDQFTIIPLLTGDINPLSTAEIINNELQINDLIIISSDLSHYLEYNQAVSLDNKTIDLILKLKIDLLSDEQACGINGIKIVIELAKINHWRAKLVDYRNSGDTAGEKDRVVGYASIGLWGDNRI